MAKLKSLRGLISKMITGIVGSATRAALGYLADVDPIYLKLTSLAANALVRFRENSGGSRPWALAYGKLPSGIKNRRILGACSDYLIRSTK